MSNDNPDLYTIEPLLINRYSDEYLNMFVRKVRSGFSLSAAFRKFIDKIEADSLDFSIIFSLLEIPCLVINLSSIPVFIHDTGHPLGGSNDLSHDDFDKLARQAYENPCEW